MKQFILGATLAALICVAGTASAYQYVDGHRTMYSDSSVVVGGQVYPVVASPSSEAEKQHKIAWLQAQLDDLVSQRDALGADKCDK
jgi:opacity protein-like surface antigen